MQYYKTNTNEVYVYEDDINPKDWTDLDLTPITEEEAKQLSNPPLTAEQKQEQVNADARAYLAKTDFYVLRELDSGKEMPKEIKSKREEARKAIK